MHARARTPRRLLVGLAIGLLTAVAGAAVGAMADSLPPAVRSWQVLVGVAVAAVVIAVVGQILLESDRATPHGLCRVAAASHGDGGAEVIAVTATGSVLTATYTEDGNWSEWTDLCAEGVTVDVTAFARVQDEVEYFAVDSHGALRTMRRGRAGTTSWRAVGGTVPGGRLRRIASVSHADDHREVFGITDTGHGVHMWSDGDGDWSAWHDMWSPSGRDVAACSTKPKLMECFVIDRDGDVWHRWWWEKRWVDWYSWGREKHAAVAVAAFRNTNELQEMLVADSTGRLAHRWYPVDASWSDWTPMPAPEPMVDVAGAATSGRKPNFFTVDRDGRLWQRAYDEGWGPWRTVPVDRVSGPRRQEVR
jgi:hypothetical protein